jgi:hypothetical protein
MKVQKKTEVERQIVFQTVNGVEVHLPIKSIAAIKTHRTSPAEIETTGGDVYDITDAVAERVMDQCFNVKENG